ncbi:MAG: phage tail tape measure protein [Actinomycetota bacterium]|nr:phage tail tape measure protein [Actinomycetota bacterium]
MGAAMGLAAKGVGAIGVGLVGVGLEAVKASTAFNHEMLRIRTDAGASTQELAAMKKGVLDLASSGASMGQGPMLLAQGLYHLESLGIRGKPALKALALASQEAAISGANLEETTTAMGAAMYTGIKGTGDLTQLMGILNATVGAGNMRFQDLVEALGTGVLPSAKVAGLGIQDVSAALAVATDSGYKASSAAAQMGTAFHFLYAPTSKAATALKSIGLPANQLAQDMHKPRGLLVALTDLHDHLQGLSKVQQAQVLNAILPGGRGRILLTELTMLDRLKGKYDQINKTAGGFQGSVAQQKHDPGTQLKTAEAGFQAQLVRLGNVLTPIVVPAFTAVITAGSHLLALFIKIAPVIGHTLKDAFLGIIGVVKSVVGWLNRHRDAAAALKVLIGVLVIGFGAWRLAIIAWTIVTKGAAIAAALFNAVINANPISIAIIAIATLAAGLVYCWKHFKTFRDVVTGVWDVVKVAFRLAWDVIGPILNILGGTVRWLWNKVFQPIFGFIKDVVVGTFQVTLIPIITGAIGVFKGLLGPINDVFGALKSIGDWVAGAGQTVSNFLNSLNPFSSNTATPLIPGNITPATSGLPFGITPGTGGTGVGHLAGKNFATAHKSAFTRASQSGKPVGAQIHAVFHNYMVVDGQVLAKSHRREVIKAMAAGA